MVVNSLSPLACAKSVGLDVADVTQGSYQLNFSNFDSFSPTVGISLFDKFTNAKQDLRVKASYSFSVDPANAKTFGSDRFVLTFDSGVLPATIKQLDNTTLSSSYATGNQWYRDGQLIQGATSQELKVDATGNYKVATKVGNCTVVSGEGSYIVTGIENNEYPGLLSIYPNPTPGVFTIELSPTSSSSLVPKIEMQDMLGQSIGEEVNLKRESGLFKGNYDLGAQSDGIYFVRIIDGYNGTITVKKIIKK
jgi:Secretion system C-terminal sorting domain